MSSRTVVLAVAALVGVAVVVALPRGADDAPQRVSITEALELAASDEAEVTFDGGTALIVDHGDRHVVASVPLATSDVVLERLLDADVDVDTSVDRESPWAIVGLWSPVILATLVIGWLLWNRRSGNGIGTARFTPAERPDVRLDDVVGADEAVVEAREIIDWLADPDAYIATGARPSSGILLIGPPGTGKTMLAKAIAGETGAPFFAVSGSDFVELFAGLGTRRVRALLSAAKKAASRHGGAVVFIDEIDAIGRRRSGAAVGPNQQEAEQTLNSLLVALDGFTARDGVVIVAATNRPEILDEALVRPGRFDRQVTLTAPDLTARQHLLGVHLASLPVPTSGDVDQLARRTAGCSGADLVTIVNIAATQAARDRSTAVEDRHLDAALERATVGMARHGAVLHPDDRRTVAVHEAGHAVAGTVLEHAARPTKVTIVPHGSSAGGVTFTDGPSRQLTTRAAATAQLTVLMAGRAAETALLGDDSATSGAAQDLRVATDLATTMTCEWGMSSLGDVAIGDTHRLPDDAQAAVRELLADARAAAADVVDRHRDAIKRVAAELEVAGTLTGDTLATLVAVHPVDEKAAR